jgi:4-aminobutyrate aminotransferase
MLLIDDEVQAGYMRTGKFLAMDNFGVKADIYTFAKSIGAGLPMGVTVTKSSLGDLKQGMHANTFGGNSTVTAGADALLGYVRRNMHRIESGIKERSRIMMKRLDAMKDKYEIVGDVRGIGMMIGIEIVKDKKSKTPGTEERNRIIKEAFEHGLVLLPAGECSIRIIPQLEIDKKVLENGLDILEEAIRKVSLSA